MNDSTRRAIRTGIDLVLGLLGSLAVVLVVPGFQDWMNDQGLGEVFVSASILILACTAFFTKLKNALEDAGKIPAVFKAPASDGANPTPPQA